MKIECAKPEAVAKRAYWLAYQAAHSVGMGFLQAKDQTTEEDVWKNVQAGGDYTLKVQPEDGRVYGDYVFGRMVKLSLEWDKTGVTCNDSQPRGDYQSWCGKYPTYESLIRAAIATFSPA